METGVSFKVNGGTPVTMDLRFDADLMARSLRTYSNSKGFGAEAELQVADQGGNFMSVRKFKCDRSNPAVGTGFMPQGPVTVSFPATTGSHFRIVFSHFFGPQKIPGLAEIDLSEAARLESYIEKQLAKMHPTPVPLADTYVWPTQSEPESPGLAVPVADIRDLTSSQASDGTLTWEVPAGEWIVQRIGMTPTGMKNSPASPEGQGLEVD